MENMIYFHGLHILPILLTFWCIPYGIFAKESFYV